MTVSTALATLATLPESPARTAWEGALSSLPESPRGTFASWCKAHDGATVTSWQWEEDESGVMRNPWAPGPRTVKAHATFATFNGSRRDYRGERVIVADDDVILIASPSGERRTLYCLYRTI